MNRNPETTYQWIPENAESALRISEGLERELGIEWTPADPEMLSQLGFTLDQIALTLGVAPHDTIPPQKFLRAPLTADQDSRLTQALQEEYASAALKLQDNLTSVTIAELGEPMVDLQALLTAHHIPALYSTRPFHAACGEWGGKPRIFWVRATVAEKVMRAAEALATQGIQMQFEDCFRPLGVQEGLFKRRVQLTVQEHPEWIDQWDKVWQEARSKTAVSPWMAGHKSGAAVDITLYTLDGQPLPTGNAYPEGGPKVALLYPYVTQAQWSTRQLFCVTMEMAGLRTYPYENWHASWGDLSAAIVQGSATAAQENYTTQYGPIKGFDLTNGEILPYPEREYYEPFFTPEELLKSILEQ